MTDTPPIRVLRVITRLNVGGPSIQAIELTKRLPARGYATILAHGKAAAREGDMRYLLADAPRQGCDVVELPSLRRQLAPIADARTAWQLFRLLRRHRPAILHTHMAKAGTTARLAAAAYNRIVPRHQRVRIVHTYHGHVLERYFGGASTKLFVLIERCLARVTDRLVAISPRIRDELLDEHHVGRPDQFRIVPLGFDLMEFAAVDDKTRADARAALDIAPTAPVISTVGRLTVIKQQHVFLEAARIVTNRHPDAVVLIAGDGELRDELEETARELGLSTNVRFLGWRRDLPIIYAATDVFLLTSRNEGTPVALIESMAAACPGISTDVGGVRDVITGPDVGLIVPFGDVAGLADAVLNLLNNETVRRRMGENARATSLERFGIDRLLNDTDHLYRELLQS